MCHSTRQSPASSPCQRGLEALASPDSFRWPNSHCLLDLFFDASPVARVEHPEGTPSPTPKASHEPTRILSHPGGYGACLYESLDYSQAVKIGDPVEISGQGGCNDELEFPESIEEEIAQAPRNVKKTRQPPWRAGAMSYT